MTADSRTGKVRDDIWGPAAEIDPSVRVKPRHTARLRARRVVSQRYSRRRLFEGMSHARVSLFRDLRVPVVGAPDDIGGTLPGLMQDGFPRGHRACVRTGALHRQLPVREAIQRWQQGRSVMGVTDLHIRGTRFAQSLVVDCLSDFNLLLCGTEAMAREEMLTMVVSSARSMTDSHSDDPDGSNHCFIGKKLWLGWDTFEGRRAGLQDVERDSVFGRAAFDMDAFLSLNSARWFVVSSGDTLFLPGHLTHKVLTLEAYLGIGSFYVSLPNCVNTIARWIQHGPIWCLSGQKTENRRLVSQIARTAVNKIQEIRRAGRSTRSRWGYDFLAPSLAAWRRRHDARTVNQLLTDPSLVELVATIESSIRSPREKVLADLAS